MNLAEDEMFDDLHEGVEALKIIVQTSSSPLSKKAITTLQRLEKTVPTAKRDFSLWKRKLAGNAVKAARKTDEVVRDHPWIFTIGAFSLGLLIGAALADSEE